VLPSPSARALTALAAARDAAYGTQVDIGNANLRPICRVERVGEHRQRAHWGVEAVTHLAPPVGRVTALISAIEIETGITIFNTGVAARKDHCMFIARVCCHSLATVSRSELRPRRFRLRHMSHRRQFSIPAVRWSSRSRPRFRSRRGHLWDRSADTDPTYSERANTCAALTR
jgi:hypothetical protein